MISIIGAGPAGGYSAYLLAKKNKPVRIFEEHNKIGIPVQCTGITTSTLKEFMPLKKQFIINKVSKAKIISNNYSMTLNLKNKNLILDRAKFDQFLVERALDHGAELKLNHKFLNFKNNIIETNKGKFKTDCLVGADGPFSKVAKVAGLYNKRKFVIGIQARVNLKNNPDLVEFYLNYGSFAWVVPENDEIVRIGLVTDKNPNIPFKQFLNNRAKDCKIREYNSGVIPMYNPNQKIQKNNIALIGDAATMIKTTTFGGIIPSLMAAQELAKGFKNYQKNFKKRLGKNLLLGLIYRKIMDKFSQKDYDDLIKYFNKEHTKHLLETHDREFLTTFLFKMIIKEPRLLKFPFRLLK